MYPQGDDRPLVLIAGGIGITPLISMLRHGVAEDPGRAITLLYSARRAGDLAFCSELRVMAERHPQVRVVVTLTRADEPTRVRAGRVDRNLLQQYVPSPHHSTFCVCGPRPMIDDVRTVLRDMGVDASQVRYEQFETAIAASQMNSVVPAAAGLPAVAGSVQVTFDTSGVSVAALASQTLLEIAEGEGVAIASSCRSGVCQACRTRLKSGDADCRSDVLEADDRAAGFVLPCVTWPNGDCVLEA